MKKLILVLTVIFLSTACKPSIKAEAEIPIHETIPVDSLIEFLFDRFVLLMEDNCIEIDYSKINSIDVLPLADGLNGIQSEETWNIVLNYYMKTPKGEDLQVRNDFIFYVLAHEIGHSQGFKHSTNPFDLMYPTSGFALGIIKTTGIEEYILHAYRK